MNRRAIARLKAYKKQGGRCFWCGLPTILSIHGRGQKHSTAEHLIPRSAGGTHAQRNIVSACRSCNSFRGHMPLAMWLIVLRETLFCSGNKHHFPEVLSSLRERGIHAVTLVGYPGDGPDPETS